MRPPTERLIMITHAEVQKLSDEELAAMNRKLGKKLMQHFALMVLAKWTLIVAVNYFGRKLLNFNMDD